MSPQSITDFNHILIFQDVSKFVWNYGSTLSVTGSAEVIAASNGETVAAAYDNRAIGGGRFVALAIYTGLLNCMNPPLTVKTINF